MQMVHSGVDTSDTVNIIKLIFQTHYRFSYCLVCLIVMSQFVTHACCIMKATPFFLIICVGVLIYTEMSSTKLKISSIICGTVRLQS